MPGPGGERDAPTLEAVARALDGAAPLHLGGPPRPVPAGTAAVVTTSGSSGHPKAVVLSADALRLSALASAERIGTGRWLLALPPTYVAGLQVLVRSVLAGTEPVAIAPHVDADAFAAATARLGAGPTYVSLVPAQLAALLRSGGAATAALSTYDAVLVGGQALDPATARAAGASGIRVVRTYGSSETAGGCVYDGEPLGGVTLRIDGGEVLIAGDMLATEYAGDAARTAAAFVREDGRRWYRTGDAGELSSDAARPRLRITGRLDNVIVSGGVNVSLDRVEQAVRELDGLSGAVVVGVPDERWGEASVVVVDRAAAAAAGTDALARARTHVAERVGAPARPSRLLVVDAVPRLPSGKPDRRALAARAAGAAAGETPGSPG